MTPPSGQNKSVPDGDHTVTGSVNNESCTSGGGEVKLIGSFLCDRCSIFSTDISANSLAKDKAILLLWLIYCEYDRQTSVSV